MRDDPSPGLHVNPDKSGPGTSAGDWLTTFRRYVVAIGLSNLAWEFAQLPLYTIWYEGRPREIVFAVVHCTGGDLLIGSAALFGALVIAGDRRWPHAHFRTVAAITVTAGFAYTVLSEWLNTEVRESWAYSEWMPTLPLIGSGLAPLAQWLSIPPLALWWAKGRPTRMSDSGVGKRTT